MAAVPTTITQPMTYRDALVALIEREDMIAAQRLENAKLGTSLKEKRIITDDDDEYFSVQRLNREFYPIKFDGKTLTKASDKSGVAYAELYNQYPSQQPIRVYHKAIIAEVYNIQF